MASRLQLHSELKKLCDNVYYQPPESVKLEYDCIIYKLKNGSTRFANNKAYHYERGYQITFVTKDPDNPLIDKIAKSFEKIRFTNIFVSENLYNCIYDLYY